MPTFKKATKQQSRARLALIGPSGSGKTYTALRIASALGKKIAVIDTESHSAAKYADEFAFDVLELDAFHPQRYIDAIQMAGAEGYDVLIIDSLTHAWAGKDGVLEQTDRVAKRSKSANSYAAWRETTPLHNALIDAMIRAIPHLIVTMRTKTEYVIEEVNGKKVPRKIGMAPIQRDGLEYEFDVVADLDLDHNMIVSKTRCKALDGAVINKPGEQVAEVLRAWLDDGVRVEPQAALPPADPALAVGEKFADAANEGKPVAPPVGELPPNPDAEGFIDQTATPTKPTADDIKFFGAIDKEINRATAALANRLGDAAAAEARDRYLRVLGNEGFEHRTEVKDHETRKRVYRAIRAAVDAIVAVEAEKEVA